MGKRSRKAHKTAQQNTQGFVVVVFASDMDQAREYETLLKVNDIQALIREPESPAGGMDEIAVMVPEDYLDEAHVIIESQDAYDDFYDLTLDDEEEFGLDDDLFDHEY